MSQRPLSDSQCEEALRTLSEHKGNQSAASRALRMPRHTLTNRVRAARARGIVIGKIPPDMDTAVLRDRIRTLESLLRTKQEDELTAEKIRKTIFDLAEQTPNPPEWTLKPSTGNASKNGVPTLLLSDLHWAEVIDPGQVNGYNEYNIAIAQRRLKTCIERTIDLLQHHLVNPSYPGIVLALGGDLFSGSIHEELSISNELAIMPAFVDLFGCMIAAITQLANAFSRVFIPAVTGNHSRTTQKVCHKGRTYTSFDWLLYAMMEKHFLEDKRIQFHVPASTDCLYRIYGHRYMLIHGDSFRGGDGLIGCIGPVFRGDNKKRSRNSQTGHEYDTLVLGHFHQQIALRKLIVSGAFCGYNEFAFNQNLPFEPPNQLLWLTHPKHGITCTWPIYLEQTATKEPSEWVSFKRAVA